MSGHTSTSPVYLSQEAQFPFSAELLSVGYQKVTDLTNAQLFPHGTLLNFLNKKDLEYFRELPDSPELKLFKDIAEHKVSLDLLGLRIFWTSQNLEYLYTSQNIFGPSRTQNILDFAKLRIFVYITGHLRTFQDLEYSGLRRTQDICILRRTSLDILGLNICVQRVLNSVSRPRNAGRRFQRDKTLNRI